MEETIMGQIDAGFEAMRSAFEATYNASDAQGVANLFAENCVVLPPDAPILYGRDAVREYYQNWFDQFEANAEIDADEARVRGDVGVGFGTYKVTLKPKAGGDPMVIEGKYLNVSKPGDMWEITRHTWNMPIPKQ
jgi:uncharacterized protein (TIGR02246 family)